MSSLDWMKKNWWVILVIILIIIIVLVVEFTYTGAIQSVITNISNFLKNIVATNLGVFGIFIYLIVISFFLSDKPKIDSILFYVLVLIVPLLVSVGYLFSGSIMGGITNIITSIKDAFSAKYIIYAILIIGVIYGLSQVSVSAYDLQIVEYGLTIISVLIGLIALAILYKTNATRIYNMPGISGFIVNFILFIPCLISDFIEYLYGEFATTPKIVYLMFIIELILILLYLYIPKIMKKMGDRFGKIIVNTPERINLKKDITNYIDMQAVQLSTDSQDLLTRPEIIVRKKFSISLWIYILPMPSNHIPYNGEAIIADFASHPRIVYDGLQKKFRIYYNNTDSDQFDAPLEKWNNLFINYDKDTVDMFLNGVLKTTIRRNQGNESFNVGDIFTIGQDNGLQGGIAKVVYYERPLLSNEISTIYTYNKDLVGIE